MESRTALIEKERANLQTTIEERESTFEETKRALSNLQIILKV